MDEVKEDAAAPAVPDRKDGGDGVNDDGAPEAKAPTATGTRVRSGRDRKAEGPPRAPSGITTASGEVLSPTRVAEAMERSVRTGLVGHLPHLVDIVDLELSAGAVHAAPAVVEQPILILIQSLRANAKVFISLRDDQRAAWSEGHGGGLVGFSISSSRDPTIYMRSFLVNSREMFVQSYKTCEELQLQLYIRTAQRDVRGRVDLPPGATVTLQTGTDRTSVVGLSSFAIEFPPVG